MPSLPALVAILALLLPASLASAAELLPAEGASLMRTHVEFRWEPACFSRGYQVEVVEDDGSADPFVGAPVAGAFVGGFEPRAVVTSGLAFGKSYAWRVRALPSRQGRRHPVESFGPWGAAHRFEIEPLPENLPSLTAFEPAPGPVEPGLTLVDIIGFRLPPGILRSVAVDRSGKVVWFNRPFGSSADVRQLEDGLMSFADFGRGTVTNLDGEVVWSTPADPDLTVHHELFPMPSGNFLTVVWDDRTVEIDGKLVELRGDRIVEFDRETKEIVWEWSTFDYYSLEDMAPFDVDNGNWTHINAVVYNRRDHSIYISSRALSRITRIDYRTREIIYNMGKDAASGEVDFGHDLFKAQHAPELLPNGNMLLHDNGTCCDLVNNKTRAIELEFDHPRDPSSASIVWEYLIPKFSRIIGDADRLPNGNTLIASGDTGGVVYEVTSEGERVWQLEVDPRFFFYRAERIRELVRRSRREQLQALVEAARHQDSCRAESRRQRAEEHRARP